MGALRCKNDVMMISVVTHRLSDSRQNVGKEFQSEFLCLNSSQGDQFAVELLVSWLYQKPMPQMT